MAERREGGRFVPLLDGIDQPHMLLEDPEQVAWIAARPHLHQADESAQLVQKLRNEL
jgi:hypothetical protein